MKQVNECLSEFFGDDNFKVVAFDVVGNVMRTHCIHNKEGDVYINLITKNGKVSIFSYSV